MPTSGSDAPAALVLDGVEAGYPGRPILHGLSLTITPGTVYALLGPNGAGKSTAARAACGLIPVRRGQVRVAGRPVGETRIGLAPQESALYPALTARENVQVTARLCGLAQGQRKAAVEHALALAACEARADEPVRTLSGGWRRRVNLAAALVGGPALLVVDEPTEGVDAATRGVLTRALRAAAAEGSGCLLISHDAAFVAETADEVGVLRQGRLVAEGPPDVLLRKTFGQSRRLTARFERPATAATVELLALAGLTERADGLEWSLTADDALSRAMMLSGAVDAESGEVVIRRPGLDDLVRSLTGEEA